MAKYSVITKPSSEASFKCAVRAFDPAATIVSDKSHSRAWIVSTKMDPVDLSGLTSVQSATRIDVELSKCVTLHQFFDYVQSKGTNPADSFCKIANYLYVPYSGNRIRTNETNFKVTYTSDAIILTTDASYLSETLYSQFNSFFQNLNYYGSFILKTADGKIIESIEESGREIYFLTAEN